MINRQSNLLASVFNKGFLMMCYLRGGRRYKSGAHVSYVTVLTDNWRALNRLAWASSRNARAPLVRFGPKCPR
jgi:hypothetical protein